MENVSQSELNEKLGGHVTKCCGNCAYWLKLKAIKGLCDKYDLGWATSDHPACKGYKRIRNEHKPRNKRWWPPNEQRYNRRGASALIEMLGYERIKYES